MAQHLNQLSGTSSHLYGVTLAAIRQCSLSAACHFSSGQHPSISRSPFFYPLWSSPEKYSHQNTAERGLLFMSLLSTFNVLAVNIERAFCSFPRLWCVQETGRKQRYLFEGSVSADHSAAPSLRLLRVSRRHGGTGYHGGSGVIAVMQRLFVLGGDGILVL